MFLVVKFPILLVRSGTPRTWGSGHMDHVPSPCFVSCLAMPSLVSHIGHRAGARDKEEAARNSRSAPQRRLVVEATPSFRQIAEVVVRIHARRSGIRLARDQLIHSLHDLPEPSRGTLAALETLLVRRHRRYLLTPGPPPEVSPARICTTVHFVPPWARPTAHNRGPHAPRRRARR